MLTRAVPFIRRGRVSVIAVVAIISAVTAPVVAAVAAMIVAAIVLTAAAVLAAMALAFPFFAFPAFVASVVMRFFPVAARVIDSESLPGDLPVRLCRIRRKNARSAEPRLRAGACEGDQEGEKRNEKKMLLHGIKVLVKMSFSRLCRQGGKGNLGVVILTEP